MSEPITGRDLAEKVLKQVVAHPDAHFQASWIARGSDEPVDLNDCGTVACLAGWAVTLNANPGETPRQALHRLARGIGIYPSWETVAAELLTPPRRSQEYIRDIFHLASEKAAVRELAQFFDLEVPAHE